MYTSFLHWLLPLIVGKRTVVMNAHIRGGIVIHDPSNGSLIYGSFIDGNGITGVNAAVEYLAD